jgi:excisionase family DNA binding protein
MDTHVATPQLPSLLTTVEVATVLRITPARVAQLARSGRLDAIRIGDRGDYRFRLEDVLALIEGRER